MSYCHPSNIYNAATGELNRPYFEAMFKVTSPIEDWESYNDARCAYNAEDGL